MRKHDYERGTPPALHSKISVNENVIGQGKVDLLRLVGERGSISAAAKEMELAYRRAWFLLETLQMCFEEPLFTSARGGSKQGGTTLTELGQALLQKHAEHVAALQETSRPFVDWVDENKRTSTPQEVD